MDKNEYIDKKMEDEINKYLGEIDKFVDHPEVIKAKFEIKLLQNLVAAGDTWQETYMKLLHGKENPAIVASWKEYHSLIDRLEKEKK